jgi:hypothetical protein
MHYMPVAGGRMHYMTALSLHSLRFGPRRTGVELRLFGRASLAWRVRRVPGAPAGPRLHLYRSGIVLDADALRSLWRSR